MAIVVPVGLVNPIPTMTVFAPPPPVPNFFALVPPPPLPQTQFGTAAVTSFSS